MVVSLVCLSPVLVVATFESLRFWVVVFVLVFSLLVVKFFTSTDVEVLEEGLSSLEGFTVACFTPPFLLECLNR